MHAVFRLATHPWPVIDRHRDHRATVSLHQRWQEAMHVVEMRQFEKSQVARANSFRPQPVSGVASFRKRLRTALAIFDDSLRRKPSCRF